MEDKFRELLTALQSKFLHVDQVCDTHTANLSSGIATCTARTAHLETAVQHNVDAHGDLLARVANCESAVAQQKERTQRAIADSGRVANQIKAIEEKLATLSEHVKLVDGAQ